MSSLQSTVLAMTFFCGSHTVMRIAEEVKNVAEEFASGTSCGDTHDEAAYMVAAGDQSSHVISDGRGRSVQHTSYTHALDMRLRHLLQSND